MRIAYLVPVVALVLATAASAQGRIWRCGNTYTNDEAEGRNCKLVEGGNVTVVLGTRANATANAANGAQPPAQPVRVAAAQQAAAPLPVQRIDGEQQRARDSDARAILEAELKKAEARLAELQKEWNNGEPEKNGAEQRNHQKYLDRVAELKVNLARTENDISGLKRELGRSGASASASK